MTNTRQVSETIYGKEAKVEASRRMRQLSQSDTEHAIASPWAEWSIQPFAGGWAVFVSEPSEPGVVDGHYSAAWLDPSRHAVDCPRRHGFRTWGENCLACAEEGC